MVGRTIYECAWTEVAHRHQPAKSMLSVENARCFGGAELRTGRYGNFNNSDTTASSINPARSIKIKPDSRLEQDEGSGFILIGFIYLKAKSSV